MREFYLTDEMKWAILVGTFILILIITLKLVGVHASAGLSDFDQAKNMCGNKGVEHLGYQYNFNSGLTEPDVTCK